MPTEPPDPYHDILITVTVYDLVTGRTHTDARASTWSWADGNWSCDCNRYDPDGDYPGRPAEPFGGTCKGCHRFVAVAAAPLLPGYALDDLNDGYENADVRRAVAAHSSQETVR